MLDDILRALRMESPAPRLSESNLRKLSRGLRSSKKSRLSVHSALETQSVQDGSLGGRSVSLSTLLPSCGPNGVGPARVDKLQSLEAKMANIEASLGLRRRREALLETLPRAARDLVRELDALQQTVNNKETTIQSLRTQITNLGGTVTGSDSFGGVISEAERRGILERLEKVQSEMEAKKVAIKNIKLTLEKIDVTDNIDVRIRAAELEYELEREELNVLNLKEETSLLSSRLQESCSSSSRPGSPANGSNNPNQQKATKLSFYELISKAPSALVGTTLVSANVCHTPGNPPFHVTSRPPLGCVIDWATDDTRLKKGDRIIEINGVIVIGSEIEEITKLMSTTSFLSLIVARPTAMAEDTLKRFEKQIDDKQKENKDLVARLDKALRERDNFKNDNTRLNHRICYLEDQVTELEDSLKKKAHFSNSSTKDESSERPSQPGATIIQVFQKGPLKSPFEEAPKDTESRDGYAFIPRIKSPLSSSSSNSDCSKGPHHPKKTQLEDYFESSSPTESSSSLEKSVPQEAKRGLTNGRESSKAVASSSSESSDHNRPQIHTKFHSKDRKSNFTGEIIDLVKTREQPPSQTGDRLSSRFSEDLRNSSESSNEYYVQKKERRSSHHQVREIKGSSYPYSSPPKYPPSVTGKDGQENHSNKNGHLKQSSSESSYEYSFSPKKSQDVHIVEKNRKYFGHMHDIKGNETSEIKLPRPRPIPPKKPERLSLHRTISLQSVEEARPSSRNSSISTSAKHQTVAQAWYSCGNDLNTDGETTDYEDLRVLRRYIGTNKNGHIYSVAPIPEERPPNPAQRTSLQKGTKKYPDVEQLSVTSVDSDYDSSPKQIYSKLKSLKVSARSKSLDSSAHLRSSLGSDYHQEVRAEPIYESIPKSKINGKLSSPPVPKPRERDSYFQAPPTPNTPPRGVDLKVAKRAYRSDEEWC